MTRNVDDARARGKAEGTGIAEAIKPAINAVTSAQEGLDVALEAWVPRLLADAGLRPGVVEEATSLVIGRSHLLAGTFRLKRSLGLAGTVRAVREFADALEIMGGEVGTDG